MATTARPYEPARSTTSRALPWVQLAQWGTVGVFIGLVLLRFVVAPLDRYDEGVVLTKAMLLLDGRLPFRDYWATYGPLDTLLLAAAFKVFGISVLVERVMGALTVPALGVAAYLLLGVVGLRSGMRLLITGLIAVVPLAVPAFNTAFLATLFGLVAVLAFLLSLERRWKGWPLIAGTMLGIASFARPEFAVALGMGLLAGYGLLAWRTQPHRDSVLVLILFLTGTLVAGAALWVPIVLAAGIGPVWLDLVDYSTRLYPAARGIPFGDGRDGLVVIVLSLAFVGVWLWATVHLLRRRRDAKALSRLVAMLVAAIAVFTWVRTRADGIHAFDAWPLTAVVLSILLAARADGRRLRLDAIAGITGLLMLSVGAGGLALRDMMGPSRGPVRGAVGIAGERSWMSGTELASLIQAIDQAVPPGHAIWVGLQRNDLVTFNDTMLYVLANRPPGTVYFEALPGLTNALPIEQTIACQLTAAGVTLLVLGPSSAGEPSNLSSVPGSTYLDQWIAAHTESRATIGGYSLITLRPDRSQAGGCLSSDAAARALGLPAVP